MIKPQTLKGFRDFLPQEARKRQYVINTLKSVFESFGFEPLETPALEYEEILTGKYGEEGDKLMYRFEDNGKRRVALRYDQTVPLSRVVAQYQNELTFPFKRYQIQPVWRAENTQKGRFREFLQCDIDTVGTNSTIADAEIIVVVEKALLKLGFKDFKIKINDRANFKDIPQQAISTIDKLKKIGETGVREELKAKGLAETYLSAILSKETTPYLNEVIDAAKGMGLSENVIEFDPSLARGLDYYTGIIIEVELSNYAAGSVAGGGRYDELIGMFSNTSWPAVGLAFGFDRIMDAMNEMNLFPSETLNASTKVLVTIFNKEVEQKSLELFSYLQQQNIAAEVFPSMNTAMDKQFKYANKKAIPYIVIIGPDEATKNVVQLKNMQTREQKEVALEELVQLLQQ